MGLPPVPLHRAGWQRVAPQTLSVSKQLALVETDEAIMARSIRFRFVTDTRGSVMVEYVIVLVLVSVGCVTAIAALGVPLYRLYQLQKLWLFLPVP